ncbi:WcaG Nucleoside-diphosphate-sugar epimerases [Candidatus Nanopelagicaceae bacterium]
MKVFLTGGRGMLGQHIKQQLEKVGHEVLAPSSAELNLIDIDATSEFIADSKPDAVIHCAAVVGGIQANIEGGGRFLTENLVIDHSVIFGARNAGVSDFLYIGSSCMYPANRLEPLQVSDLLSGPLEPTNASYALAKITGAKAVEAFDSVKELNWKTFIASNLYGPGDHFEPTRSHLVAAIISKVQEAKERGDESIIMWGDGKVKREFTYVIDFAEWISVSISNLERFPSLINVGCGVDFTVQEFYEIAMKELEFDGKLDADLSKPNGNLRKLMDSSVARGLGWNPSTSINEGISNTHKWLMENVRHA